MSVDRVRPAEPSGARSWSQFPAAVSGRSFSPDLFMALLVASAPAAGIAAGTGESPGAVLGVAAVAALGGVAAWRFSRGVHRGYALAVCAVSIVAIGLLGGRPAAWSFVAGTFLVALCALLSEEPGQRGGRSAEMLEPAAGLSLLAALLGWRTASVTVVLAIQVGTGGLVYLAHRNAELAGRGRTRVLQAVTVLVQTVGAVLIAVLGLFMVLIPWAIGRCVAWDPTWWRHRPASQFVPLRRVNLNPRWQWRGRVESLNPGIGRRMHAVALVVPVFVVAGLVFVTAGVADLDGDPSGVGSPAMAGSRWWPEARPAQLATYDEARLSGFLGPVLADVSTEWTNVVDGRRVSWSPDSPRYTVWLFGGSAAFGLGQRDGHTIASELARAADARGVPIEVINMAVHGDVHWMEWNRMLAALTAGAEKPDLVIFYDGFNELATVNHVNNSGRAADLPFVGSLDSHDLSRRGPLESFGLRLGRSFDDTGLQPPPTTRVLNTDEMLERAIAQFTETIRITAAELESREIPVMFVYQPSRVTRARPVEGEESDGTEFTALEASFRSRLPGNVVDLSAAMDQIADPVYWDSVHTNELGSSTVAAALVDQVVARLSIPTGEAD